MEEKEMEVVPGLAGIPAAESSISFIDGEKGILEYRGMPVEVLAEKSSFLETSYLLIFGKLPPKLPGSWNEHGRGPEFSTKLGLPLNSIRWPEGAGLLL